MVSSSRVNSLQTKRDSVGEKRTVRGSDENGTMREVWGKGFCIYTANGLIQPRQLTADREGVGQ
jgi:hypothetical protein